MSTSNRREVRRSSAVAPCRPSKPMRDRTSVAMAISIYHGNALAGFLRSAFGFGSGRRRGLFLHLALDDLALDRPHHVDEQARRQVVVLMLQRPGEQGLALDGEGLPLDVEGPYLGPH